MKNRPTNEQVEGLCKHIDDVKTKGIAQTIMKTVLHIMDEMPELEKFENDRFITAFVGDSQVCTVVGTLNMDIAEIIVNAVIQRIGEQRGIALLISILEGLINNDAILKHFQDAQDIPKSNGGGFVVN
jgi:hypothetical protein